MFRCNTNKCDNSPIGQCDSCDGLLFCENCYLNHFKEHTAKKNQYNFDGIKFKLSESQTKILKYNIVKSIKIISNQKEKIIKEALKLNT